MPMPEHLRRRTEPLPKLGVRFFASSNLSPDEWLSPGLHFEHGLVGMPITKSSVLTDDRGWVLGATPESSNSTDLCAQCSDIDVDMLCLAWLPYREREQGPVWNWGEVQNRPWCQFCRVLADAASRQPWEASPFDPARTTLRLRKSGISWDRATAEPGESDFWPSGLRLLFEQESRTADHDGDDEFPLYDASPGFILPVGDASASSRENIGCIRPVGEVIDPAIPRLWLEACTEGHAECADTLKLEAPDFDIRVVDTEKMSIVRLPPGEDYVTLSYVWGTSEQPRLRSDCYEAWAREGGLRDVNIPLTIADAIEVTRVIGQRYLWVDAICIVQDDPCDFERQIRGMHKVYYHSLVTIVAAGGDDVNAGLPGSSHLRPRVGTAQQIHTVSGKQFAISGTDTSFELVSTSTWNTRAWTFQERLLSRRLLYFTKTSIFFECRKTHWVEDSYGEPAFHWNTSGPEGPIRPPGQDSSYFQSSWDTFVRAYLARSLTNPNDILNGMTGVLAAMKDSWGEFHFGIPLKDFWAELVWYWNEGHFPRRAGFPSWSWCGWDTSSTTTVSPAQRRRGLHFFRDQDGSVDRGLLDIFIMKNGQLRRAGISSEPVTPRTDHEHFYLDEESIRRWCNSHVDSGANVSQFLFFHTSSALLRLEHPPSVGGATEATNATFSSLRYPTARIVNPKSGKKIGSILLPRDREWDPRHSALHDFIVIVQCEPSSKRSTSREGVYEEDYPRIHQSKGEAIFRLMLISWESGVAYRVAISSAIFATDWWDCRPEKKLIVLG